MIESFFTQEYVDSMRPHIQETVDHLLDTVVKFGSEKPIDLVEKFSLPLPSYVSPFTVIEDIMTTSSLLSF
jgi:fungal nitric oxide reductase